MFSYNCKLSKIEKNKITIHVPVWKRLCQKIAFLLTQHLDNLTVWIQISQLHQKLADQDPHCYYVFFTMLHVVMIWLMKDDLYSLPKNSM